MRSYSIEIAPHKAVGIRSDSGQFIFADHIKSANGLWGLSLLDTALNYLRRRGKILYVLGAAITPESVEKEQILTVIIEEHKTSK